jgi:hypothetical protein
MGVQLIDHMKRYITLFRIQQFMHVCRWLYGNMYYILNANISNEDIIEIIHLEVE